MQFNSKDLTLLVGGRKGIRPVKILPQQSQKVLLWDIWGPLTQLWKSDRLTKYKVLVMGVDRGGPRVIGLPVWKSEKFYKQAWNRTIMQWEYNMQIVLT